MKPPIEQLAMISPIVAAGVVVFLGILLWRRSICPLGHDWQTKPLHLTTPQGAKLYIRECRRCERRESIRG